MAISSPIEVLMTVSFSDAQLERLRSVSPYLNITTLEAETVSEIPVERWMSTHVLYTDRLLPPSQMAKNLKWVQLHWTGASLLQGSELAAQTGKIVFTTLSGATSSKVAEYVLMSMLALGHQLPKMIKNQSQAKWPQDIAAQSPPREIRGSVVGIVGFGSIGREVARLLRPFDCTVLATKRDAMNPGDSGYYVKGQGDPGGDLFHRLYPPQALHSMLRECDLVVVAVPAVESTHHLIDEAALSVMKKSAYLVNISEGVVVDETALFNALQQGSLAGAALDAFSKMPLPGESPLWSLPNVIITPHVARESAHYHERAMDLFIENCTRFIAEQPLYNQVDLQRGY